MPNRGLVLSGGCTRGTLPSFMIAALLFLASFASPAPPVRASHQPGQEPERLEVDFKVLRIRDDQDWFGSGELSLLVRLETCDVRAAVHPCWNSKDFPPQFVGGWWQSFSADSGDILTLDRLFPRAGDEIAGAVQTQDVGFAAYPGHAYRLVFSMIELDPTAIEFAQCIALMCDPDPDLGRISLDLDEANRWAIGVHSRVRSVNPENGEPGDFDVTFEVRPTPLPDLWARGIRQIGEGSQAFYCVMVQNVGDRASGQFPLSVYTDRRLLRTLDPMPALEVGETTEHCAARTELPAEKHLLSFVVDEDRRVTELHESNNRYDWGIPAR